MASDKINVGILGMGVVGTGVVGTLLEKADQLSDRLGKPIHVSSVVVRDESKLRDVNLPSGVLTTDASAVLDNPNVDIVVELVGGEQPAFGFIQRALTNGKHVVTANKEVVAKFGPQLFSLAEEKGVDLCFEASVGGGIPLIVPFRHSLAANSILSIKAIINGTTNYILTKMAEEGWSFEDALREAQSLGYAEANPDSDVLGIDASFKLAILASLGFRMKVHPDQVYREGITRLHSRDFCYANEFGYGIKLLGIAKCGAGKVEARVHPALIPLNELLAQVNGVFNAVQAEGDLTGPVLFYGQGAGSAPTASAVVSDIIDVAHNINAGVANRVRIHLDRNLPVLSMAEVETRYYLRMQVADGFSVLAQIAYVLGDHNISIASVVQKEVFRTQQTAEIVIMTHLAREDAMQGALSMLEGLPVVHEISSFIRVEG